MDDYTGHVHRSDEERRFDTEAMLRESREEGTARPLHRHPTLYRVELTTNDPLTPSGIMQAKLELKKGFTDSDTVTVMLFAAKAPEMEFITNLIRSGSCLVHAEFNHQKVSNTPKET